MDIAWSFRVIFSNSPGVLGTNPCGLLLFYEDKEMMVLHSFLLDLRSNSKVEQGNFMSGNYRGYQ